jgi:hypothetical protein
MVLDKVMKQLESSKIFKEWRKENENYYLVHAFLMIDPKVKQVWQIGYYNKKNDKIVTFDVGDEIFQNPESDVFKKEGVVNPLDLKKVKVDYNKALKIAEKFAKEHYPNYKIGKKILILQNLDKEVWNMTFVGISFETLNIKIDAKEGKIFYHNLSKIFSFDNVVKNDNS